MKQISPSLTSKLKSDSVVERDYIIFSGEETRHYIWFNLYDDCYKDGNFIGTFIMKRIEFTYKDSDLEFKNKEFNAYKEYKLDNETWESINYGTFVVTNVDPSDTKEEITVTAYDYALKFANPYKTDLDYASGKVTLFQVLQEICQKVGVELENTSIENGNFIVDSNQFGENTLYGNVITAIAQISCNFAKITPENKLKLLFKNESNITIETKDYEEFEDKRDTLPYNAVSLGMSNVEGENVTLVAQGVDPDEAKYLTINDNPFAYTQEKRTQLIQAIFDKVNGFGYSSFVLSNCLYPQLECGDLVKIRNKERQLVNSIVLRPTFEETVLNFEAPSTITSSVTYVQPVDAIEIAKRTEIIVNKQEQTIQAVVSEVGQYDERITNVEQSVEGLTTQVSEIANLIRETSGNNSLIIEDASANNLKSLSIKGQISLLFGNNGKTYGIVPLAEILYPSSTLFGKNMNLIVEGTEETQTIKLPFTFLNYINNEICDEFLLQDGKASVIRRVGINSNLEKYELEQEVIEDLGELNITLFDSYNKLYLQCFDNAILSASYMVKNEYTDEFATKVELNSSLKQTSSSIIAEVNADIDSLDKEINGKLELKLNTDDLTTEFNANVDKINLQGYTTVNEDFKINLDGTMEAKNGKFNGSIELISAETTPRYTIKDNTDSSIYYTQSARAIRWVSSNAQLNMYLDDSQGIYINMRANEGISDPNVANTDITPYFIKTTSYQQLSLKSIKKNIKLFDKYAIDIINSADLYSYNLKKENDDDKKHIGLVIGDGEKDYNTPDEVITKDKQGIDLYSMISLSWKAIQEQQQIIEDLQKRVETLEAQIKESDINE